MCIYFYLPAMFYFLWKRSWHDYKNDWYELYQMFPLLKLQLPM